MQYGAHHTVVCSVGPCSISCQNGSSTRLNETRCRFDVAVLRRCRRRLRGSSSSVRNWRPWVTGVWYWVFLLGETHRQLRSKHERENDKTKENIYYSWGTENTARQLTAPFDATCSSMCTFPALRLPQAKPLRLIFASCEPTFVRGWLADRRKCLHMV